MNACVCVCHTEYEHAVASAARTALCVVTDMHGQKKKKKKKKTPGGARTRGLEIRSLTRYQLRYKRRDGEKKQKPQQSAAKSAFFPGVLNPCLLAYMAKSMRSR